MNDQERNLTGYGARPPEVRWPGAARIAVQFVLNYEEGGENCVANGDAGSEQFLSELFQPPSYPARHRSVESLYEYGSRAGVWRLLGEFERRGLPLTAFAVGLALERNPEVARALAEGRHEIAAHGWRWINYQEVPEAVERDHVARAVATIQRLAGSRPHGWYTGRDSPNTRRLVVDEGGFEYDSDSYADDLPYWTSVTRTDDRTVPHLVVPYTLDTNDMKFAVPPGFGTGENLFAAWRDAFDVLYAEGAEFPKMLSLGMHCRLLGRPGRFRALQRFLDHLERHDRVWICRRVEIARHWREFHPPPGGSPLGGPGGGVT